MSTKKTNPSEQHVAIQKEDLQDLWVKNRRDLIGHNLLSVRDLSELLGKIKGGKISFSHLSRDQADLLLADLFWMQFTQSRQIRDYLVQESRFPVNKIRTQKGFKSLQAFLDSKSESLPKEDMRNLIARIEKEVSAEDFEPYPESTLLGDHWYLRTIFSVNPIRLIGQQQVFVGQLISQQAAVPLRNYRIQAWDISAKPNPIGASVIDGAGFFAFFLPTSRKILRHGNQVEAQRRLRLHVVDEQFKEIHQVEILVTLPQRTPEKIRVPSLAKQELPSPTLGNLAKSLGRKIPGKLNRRLQKQGVRSLDDIRKKSGIQHLPGLESAEYIQEIGYLEAHADLYSLSSDLKVNDAIIKKGFTHTNDIARSPLISFVQKVGSEIGENTAVMLHRTARARVDFLNNVLTGARADWANYRKPPFFDSDVSPMKNLFEESCECKDCDAAVSPRAYLADLLAYAIQNLRSAASANILEYLTSVLHQPFADLPASCEAVNTQLRQVRICIEVLRSHLKTLVEYLSEKDLALWCATSLSRLIETGKAYNQATYSTLLQNIGTSYTELRLLATLDEEHKKGLADRLGIPLDFLDGLALNPNAYPDDPQALTEQNLERVFGLVDTRRNPLSEGAKIGDHLHSPIKIVSLSGIVWKQNTDDAGIIHASLQKTQDGRYYVGLYRDRDRTTQVASGQCGTSPGKMDLMEDNHSGLTGSIEIDYTEDILNFEICAIQEFSGWHPGWHRGQIVYWKFNNVEWNRNTDRNGIVFVLLAKVSDQEYSVVCFRDRKPSRKSMVASGMSKTPWGNIVLQEENDSGLTGEVAIDYIADSTCIEIAAIPLYLAGRLAYLRQSWKEQDWPADFPQAELPLIDPDVIGPDDFRVPYAIGGPDNPKSAFDLWIRRRQWVDTTIKELMSRTCDGIVKPSSSDFDNLLAQMKQGLEYAGKGFSSPWPPDVSWDALDVLYGKLTQGKSIQDVIDTIETTYHLNLDSFTRLMELYNKDQQFRTDPRKEEVTAEEWEAVYSILAQAQKQSLFQVWRAEEERIGLLNEFGPKYFWMCMHEPKQGKWPNSLPKCCPEIDPEFVTEDELQQSPRGKRAIRLWQARTAQLHQITRTLQATHDDAGFQAMLKVALGDPDEGDDLPCDLDKLNLELDNRDPAVVDQAILTITKLLYMTAESFSYLMDIRAKVARDATAVTAVEWKKLLTILTRAHKVKWMYRVWIQEEHDPHIDPDYVKLSELPDPTAGTLAIRLWQIRKARLDQIVETLKAKRENEGFDATLREALGHPDAGNNLAYDLNKIYTDLGSGDTNKVDTAIREITEGLFMTVDDFRRLITIRDKALAPDPASQPTDEEWTDVCSILRQAQKEKRETPKWIEQEKSMKIEYWTALKARLPEWRAPVEARQKWQQALQICCMPPIIDPDLVGLGDLRNCAKGDPAAEVLIDRSEKIKDGLEKLAIKQADYQGNGTMSLLYAFDGLFVEYVFDESGQKTARDQLRALYEATDLGTLLCYVFKNLELSPDDWGSLGQLYIDLESESTEEQKKAKRTVKELLFLPVEQFQRLIQIAASANIDDHLEQVYDILSQAFLVGMVMGLENDQRQGCDILPRLEQYNLSNAAFSFLVQMRHLLANDAALQLEEWSNIYSILMQILKREQTAWMRREEKQNNITLSPDFFKLPENELFGLDIFEPIPWRATYGQRREWQRKLESRIDQEQTTIASMRETISTAEETHLPMLRDALILATMIEQKESGGKKITFEEQSSQLSDHLVIDTKAGGSQTTTRISQAITTIQNLLWLTRTGQIRNISLESQHVDLTLMAENFDEEWKWMGSYATWRAAIFVFMYPENLLIPALRPGKLQTPAFRDLVNALRSTPRLTPRLACEAAKQYESYFRDICSLEVQATCQARVHAKEVTCSNKQSSDLGYRDLFFMFARGEETGAIYWASCSAVSNDLDTSQTLWKPLLLEQVKVKKVLGAVPYEVVSGSQFVCLFLHVQAEGVDKLILKRYDLDDGSWEDGVIELSLPDDITSFNAIVAMQVVERSSPWVQVISERNAYFYNALNSKGTDWRWNWRQRTPPQGTPGQTVSLALISTFETGSPPLPGSEPIGPRGILEISYDFGTEELRYTTASDPVSLGNTPHTHLFGKGRMIGAYPFYVRGQATQGNRGEIGLWIVFYWYDVTQRKTMAMLKYLDESGGWDSQVGTEPFPASSEFSSLESIPVHSIQGFQYASDPFEYSSVKGVLRRMFAYNQPYLGRRCTYKGWLKWGNYVYPGSDMMPDNPQNAIAPLRPFISILDIVPRISDVSQQNRYEGIRESFCLHENTNLQVYIEEAYYFVPMAIALALQHSREYITALDWFRSVFDYERPVDQWKIYYGLIAEETIEGGFQRAIDWLLDPINPHAIAVHRPNAYTRFTVLSIIRCLLDYADNEFTLDTSESVPRARILYEAALKLLDSNLLKQSLNERDAIIGTLDIEIGSRARRTVSQRSLLPGVDREGDIAVAMIKRDLKKIQDIGTLKAVVQNISNSALSRGQTLLEGLTNVRNRIAVFKVTRETRRIGAVVGEGMNISPLIHSALLADPSISSLANDIVDKVKIDTLQSNARTLPDSPYIWPKSLIVSPTEHNFEDGHVDVLTSSKRYSFKSSAGPTPSYLFCIPPNPIIMALRLHAEVSRVKIEAGKNIAGMERILEPYAAPTDTVSGLPSIGAGGQVVLPGTVRIQPTPYRYRVLIDRAKQLAQLAAQMESAMLAALEKRDAEYYNRLKAEQDIQMAKGQVRLQSLRVKEAEDGVTLAELQQERAQLQVETLQEMIDAGLNQYEQEMIDAYNIAAAARIFTAFFDAAIQMAQAATTAATASFGAPAAAAGAALVSVAAEGRYMATGVAIGAETSAQVASIWASFERRKQEWEYQQRLAEHDVLIGGQGITLAKDRVGIVKQEHEIAEMQTRHAEEVKDFLVNKFTNVELYDWMSNVLEGVYSFFLQQATSIAHLAANQLAFERQEAPPLFIQADYWEAPSEMGMGVADGAGPDRRGLTGSARLLQDIYQLDQHAFETDKRKLQLVKVISLSQLAPAEFQRFRETGIMTFMTPMALFDQDFPGHHLRLIKQVRTSVVALIPPIHGIKACLSATGLSRVVIGPDVFQTVNIRRSPETVALTSPMNATGLFDLEPQSEMLYPFEAMGVDTTWEFRMPKVANRFDYSTIADVLLAIEYTALDSYTYRQQVVQELDSTFRGERPYSLRHDFPDEWYQLHNPDQAPAPMVAKFTTRREHFPPNLGELQIEQVLLYFGRADGGTFEIPVTHLTFTEEGGLGSVGGAATTIDGYISTRKSNAGSWIAMIGKSPAGKWELELPNTAEMKNRFKKSEITDILFVLSYNAHTPEWPA